MFILRDFESNTRLAKQKISIMSVTVNDQTHTLFVVALSVWGVTAGYAMNRMNQRWTAVAYSFLAASLLIQVLNSYLVQYGIGWNIESPVNAFIVLVIASLILFGLTQTFMSSIPLAALLCVLFGCLLGQAFILEWVQSNAGITVEWSVFMGAVTLTLAIVWYLVCYISDTTWASIAFNSIALIACSTLATKILTLPATWSSWSQPIYTIEILDWYLAIDAVATLVVFLLLWRFLRYEPPIKGEKMKKEEVIEEENETSALLVVSSLLNKLSRPEKSSQRLSSV